MSGFEVAGLVLGILPIIAGGLKFYEGRAKDIIYHENAMNNLITSLHVEHSRFRYSCETLVTGLIEDAKLKDILDNATEAAWKDALEGGLEVKLREKLDYRYYGYSKTMAQIQENLRELEKVVGLSRKKRWYEQTEYQKLRWHARTWKKMKDCLDHDKHEQLLADLDGCNTRLEKLTPRMSDPEHVVASKPEKVDLSRWESITRSAKSLHCALCSGWLCQCSDAHVAQFRLDHPTALTVGSHRFRLEFMLPTGETAVAMTGSMRWQEAEFEASEEEEEDMLPLPPRPSGRVAFAPARSHLRSRMPSRHITDLCSELQQSVNNIDAKCIGFIVEDKRKHYIHLPKRPLAQPPSRSAVSLHHLLLNKGSISSPFPVAIELLDKYELALLLASSLLQLHTTPWLGERWSTKDIHFTLTDPEMTLRDCAFLVKSFPSTARHVTSDTPTRSLESPRQLVIRNEAIFRLGATLVELSTTKTLKSQETEEDRKIPELTDVYTAQRVSGQIERNNVREWNEVVGICLRCGFHALPDFTKKGFRQEFYELVVIPLQRLYNDAKPGS